MKPRALYALLSHSVIIVHYKDHLSSHKIPIMKKRWSSWDHIVFNSTQLKLTILVRCIYVKTIPWAYWVVYLILTMILFEDITKNACLNSSFHLKISGLVFACESYLSCIYNLSPVCLAAGQTNREKKLQVERQEDKIIPYCIPHAHHTNDIGIKIQNCLRNS